MTIRELREHTGMSQSKFATLLEIPVGTLQHWEQGFRNPPSYVTKLIERVLKGENYIK